MDFFGNLPCDFNRCSPGKISALHSLSVGCPAVYSSRFIICLSLIIVTGDAKVNLCGSRLDQFAIFLFVD
jgi:hypothetical protein